MIINTGGRTDTVQYYSEWLLRRFEEGYVLARNPLYPCKVTRYELDPRTVDCVVFCSKNYAPILPRLHEITTRFNTNYQYTITAYGKDIEPGVPSIDESVRTLLELERQGGARRICWRYDPVLLTRNYTVERHLEIFGHLASQLTGHVDRCIFSFVEIYEKLKHNMPELRMMSTDEMDELARCVGAIAAQHGLWLQTWGLTPNPAFSALGAPSSCPCPWGLPPLPPSCSHLSGLQPPCPPSTAMNSY